MNKLLPACALALAMFSVAPALSALEPMPITNGAVAVVVTNDAQPSAALATLVTADAAAVSLSLREMQQVHGSGFWSKITNFFKRVYQWVISPNGQKILKALWDLIQKIMNPQPTPPPCGMNCTQTDYFSNNTQANEYYDESGNLVGADESSTGDVFEGSDVAYDRTGPEVLQATY